MIDKELGDFFIYAHGICYASVCSSLPQAEVEARMLTTPTGVSTPWRLSKEKFKGGEPNPNPCNSDGGRLHYLFSC